MHTAHRKPRVAARRAGRPLAALLAAAVLAGCEKPAPPAPPPPMVQVMEVRNTPIPMGATLIGQLDSPQNVEVRARVEAFVEKICFTEGGKVQQGDLLFELDRRPFIEKLAAANASLAQVQVAERKYANDVARLRPLVTGGGVSKQDLENAEAQWDASKASVAAAKASVESAQLDLGYCEVRAPIAGLIGAKEVSVGDLVGKGQPTLLATMSTLDPMWFYCNVSEVDYVRTKARAAELGKDLGKLPLILIRPDGSEHKERGRLVFVDRAVNVKTGTLRLRAEFPNPTEILRPGMFARVRIEAGTHEGIQVPERAIFELQGKSFVWVVDQDQVVHQCPVTPGDPNGSNIVLLDGLQPGQRIIVEGVAKVRDGGRVTVAPAGQADAAQAAPADAKPTTR